MPGRQRMPEIQPDKVERTEPLDELSLHPRIGERTVGIERMLTRVNAPRSRDLSPGQNPTRLRRCRKNAIEQGGKNGIRGIRPGHSSDRHGQPGCDQSGAQYAGPDGRKVFCPAQRQPQRRKRRKRNHAVLPFEPAIKASQHAAERRVRAPTRFCSTTRPTPTKAAVSAASVRASQ